MSDPAEAEIPYRAAAARLCFVLLVLLALVVIHLSLEKGKRPELESFAELTAVGDLEFYRLPAPLPATPVPATTFQGRPLVPVTYRRFDLREPRMTKVGEDDAHRLRIYHDERAQRRRARRRARAPRRAGLFPQDRPRRVSESAARAEGGLGGRHASHASHASHDSQPG